MLVLLTNLGSFFEVINVDNLVFFILCWRLKNLGAQAYQGGQKGLVEFSVCVQQQVSHDLFSDTAREKGREVS